jgi:(p)ppGpp synthase/HD superfamily hydrolase
MKNNLVLRAASFAAEAHKGQVRKYTGQKYIVHPIEVMNIVASVPHTDAMLCAALLHDTVEDCGVTLEQIKELFGPEVEDLVFWLTDPPKGESGMNRAVRKELSRQRLEIAPPEAQTIKLADLISNTASIVKHDPDFAVVYLREKAELLKVLVHGDSTLMAKAKVNK